MSPGNGAVAGRPARHACGTSSSNSGTTAPGATGSPRRRSLSWTSSAPVRARSPSCLARYAEDGSNDPKTDWVTRSERRPAARPRSDFSVRRTRPHADEDRRLRRGLRLRGRLAAVIASGDVAPVNTSLVPELPDIASFLKDKSWNSVNGQCVRHPHGWGATCLNVRHRQVNPAPTSWPPCSPTRQIRRQGHRLRLAHLHRDAGSPDEDQTRAGHQESYALDDKQLQAAVDLLKLQKPNVANTGSDYLKEVQSSRAKTPSSVRRGRSSSTRRPARRPRSSDPTGRRLDRLVGHLDVAAKAAPELQRPMDELDRQPEGEPQVANTSVMAPANAKACEPTSDKSFCETTTRRTPRTRSRFGIGARDRAVLDGRTDVNARLLGLDEGLDRDQGLGIRDQQRPRYDNAAGRHLQTQGVGTAHPVVARRPGSAAELAAALARARLHRRAGGVAGHRPVTTNAFTGDINGSGRSTTFRPC